MRRLGIIPVGALMLTSVGCSPSAPPTPLTSSELPHDLELTESEPQTYQLTCVYSNRGFHGNIRSRKRIVGEYTRALPDGYSEWRNVRISEAAGADAPFPEGEIQAYLEGFRYRPSEADLFDESFFADFPPGMSEPRALIYDMAMAEDFAWRHFDKVRLNQAYLPEPEPKTIQMGEGGTFKNQDLRLTWIGTSTMNGEESAVIQYRSLFNPMNLSVPGIVIKGRSSYWGEIFVSLEDKQIEFATLYEDGLVEIAPGDSADEMLKAPSVSRSRIANVFREMTFEKVLPTD